ncbi:MAG: flagellar basal-body rod protein FlgF [Nitrospirae bacterium]|nr:flagellar basal-body rod protein FlgF [Nitrospirota bacterium]
MNKGIYPALSGGIAYEKMITVISNNVANINTSGYKADRPVFKVDMPSAALDGNNPPPTPFSKGGQGGIIGGLDDKFYTEIDSLFTDFSAGVIKQTGNPLDLAIEGDGFFVIDSPDGPRYTRSGNFTLDASNMLTTVDGDMVSGDNGPIILEQGRITIDSEGRVSVNGSEVNRIRIVDFDRPYNLEKDQGNMFAGLGERTAEGYKILQGAIELSNVNSVKEMASMITVLRGYESYQKVMTTLDETSAKANEVGRV